ncbi:hypothetical protein ACWWJF_00720 [Symbiopectobacterium sp. Eva_TO]
MADPFSAGIAGISSILGGGTAAAGGGFLSGIGSMLSKGATLQNAAGGATLLGGLLGASNASSQAKQQAALYGQQAATLRSQANNVNASAQVQAGQEIDKARQAESTALANAAASGGGASDVGVVNNISDIAAQGQLNNMTTLWNGEQQAIQLKNQANVLDTQAKIAKKSARSSGLASILGTGASLFSIYK